MVILHLGDAANPWEVLGRLATLKNVIRMDVKEWESERPAEGLIWSLLYTDRPRFVQCFIAEEDSDTVSISPRSSCKKPALNITR